MRAEQTLNGVLNVRIPERVTDVLTNCTYYAYFGLNLLLK
jgi:hypothetical protein